VVEECKTSTKEMEQRRIWKHILRKMPSYGGHEITSKKYDKKLVHRITHRGRN